MGEVLLKGSKTTISPFLFKKLREEGEFFDVTLVPGNETFGGTHVNAHKVILSAFSPVFKNMLRGTPHTVTPMILLRDIDYEELIMLMDYIYNGEVSLNESKLDRFLHFANDLKIQGLDLSSGNSNFRKVEEENDFNCEDVILCEEFKSEFLEPYEDDYPTSFNKDEVTIEGETEMLDCDDEFLEAKHSASGVNKSPDPVYEEANDFPYSSSPSYYIFHCNEAATYGKTQRGRPMLIDKSGYVYVCEKKRCGTDLLEL
uniref:Broad-complex core protein isoform 6 n=1 Tax=Lepeophtheirus salmonis TaxID=72036 RepID=D3PHI4_LEPSM|nr:Broad-complex core protein isoform 6 [Lepeophtheirus salmonis]